MTLAPVEISPSPNPQMQKMPASGFKLSKPVIRSSLKASTIDGVFSAIFGSITTGVLLSNFLLELGATSVEIGMLSSFPMLVNLLQPLGAYLGDKCTSRLGYLLWIFSPSRLLWLILVLGIWASSKGYLTSHQLIYSTLAIVLVTHVMGSLGSPAWVSWMAFLVPRQLRGRYFGFRNSAASLMNLLGIPLLGLVVSAWPGGTIEGYAAILLLGVIFGAISLVCQFFMADVNPRLQALEAILSSGKDDDTSSSSLSPLIGFDLTIFKETNFLWFLLYFSLWMFAVNVSNPFFNLYMLDNLEIDVSWVTIYNSFTAGANLLMLLWWGKLADRIGNRLILLLVGMVVAVTPILWLLAGSDRISLWVWLPLLHLIGGGTWAAIDLCSNNIQMDVVPQRNQASYFAIAAAVSGVAGAIGTTAGGFLAQFADYGGLPGLFVLSGLLRLVALIPLIFIRERCSQPFVHLMQLLHQKMPSLFPPPLQPVPIPTADLRNGSK
jgi:MFS family permease